MTREEAIQILTETQVVYFAPKGKQKAQEALEMAIEALSTNMVSVVRCKDCHYCTEYYDRDGYPYWICDEWDSGTDADGFCHYGERKKR